MVEQNINEQILSKITEKRIFTIHGQRVLLDSDLAELYEAETRILKRNVQRNIGRFRNEICRLFISSRADFEIFARVTFIQIKKIWTPTYRILVNCVKEEKTGPA